MKARGGKWSDFLQRFGKFRPEQIARLKKMDRPLWVHAVSVGEVGVAIKFVKALRAAAPLQDIVMTTTTPTGHGILEEFAKTDSAHSIALYSPIDGWRVVRRFLQAIRPSQFILLESELWPNLLHACEARGIPILLINARLSPRSERRYKKLRVLTEAILAPVKTIMVPEAEDIPRWAGIGVPEERLIHTGSLKYDPGSTQRPDTKIAEFGQILRETLLWKPSDPVLLAASTHEGEERLIAELFQKLQQSGFPHLKLILVPRHVERREDIVEQLKNLGVNPCLRSQLGQQSEVLLVDTTGELLAWQYQATLVIVGKSFTGEGGQNPAEAVFAQKPVVFGPNMQNFEPLVKLLLDHQGAIQVEDAMALEKICRSLLEKPEMAHQLAMSGHQALAKHQGAVQKTVEIVLSKTAQK